MIGVDLLRLLGNSSTVWPSHFCRRTEQEARLDPESVNSTWSWGVTGGKTWTSHLVEMEGSYCCDSVGLT